MNRFNEDKDNDNDKTISINKIKDKTKGECKDEDMLIKVFSFEEMNIILENEYWIQTKTVWIYWNNNPISEIDEMWTFYKDNYAYTRLEKLSTCSGESLYDREHRATISKKINLLHGY